MIHSKARAVIKYIFTCSLQPGKDTRISKIILWVTYINFLHLDADSCMYFVVHKNSLILWKQPKCPSVDECIKQLWGICTMEYYSVIKKNIFPFVTVWMDLENIMLNEISQSEKDKYHMISLTSGI